MTAAEFKKKWAKVSAKESAAYQSHFDDLCRVLGIAPPLEADPTGEVFCYQKRVVKDAELFGLDAGEPDERGFADVWKRGCFAWEYKGKKKNLDEAYRQLLRYRESLLNPPLLVVCDFDRYIVRTNFNDTVQTVHEFTNAQLDDPKIIELLRHVFTNPNYLRPMRTTAEVTEELAGKIAAVARSLQGRECVELEDAHTRRELRVAQKKNLRIARFLNRVMFCFFAEDTGLLPKNLFSEIARAGLNDRQQFVESLEELFRVMSKGGRFGHHKIRHFNGHLFDEATVFELTDEEIGLLAAAAESDWQFIQPSIMGTLFERALEPEQRSQLGAHYTGEADIKTLVEPVLMAPWRREWQALREEVRQIHLSTIRGVKPGQKKYWTSTGALKPHCTTLQYNLLNKFVERLAAVRVLDPACGSGNFLYVSLQLLLGLEKEVTAFGTEIDVVVERRVSVQQLNAIEINRYAFELAQVSVQIGFLQWRRDNGFDNDRTPVLQNLDGFQNEDALLVPHFRSKAKTLKDAQAGEHAGDDALKFYTEREWPECDVIVGNPPFLGDKLMRRELGNAYVEELRRVYHGRIPGQSDLCCYWFEKARDLIERGHCKRAGLLATQGIRGGANREVLQRIKRSGDIYFGVSDREWILNGAMVHISMLAFDSGIETERLLDGMPVQFIPANLSMAADITASERLAVNADVGFIGVSMHGPFDTEEAVGLAMLEEGGNPNLRPNSDVIRPVLNAIEITQGAARRWLVSFPPNGSLEKAVGYAAPMALVKKLVFPLREKNHRKTYRDRWWLQGEARPAMQQSLAALTRFVATPRVSKHRIFVWIGPECLPSDATVAFARDDDYFFGVAHSRIHEVWALAQGTQLREKESGFRYTPTSCFETFPFPFADDLLSTKDNPAHIVAKFRAAHYHTEQSSVLREDPPPRTPDEHRAAISGAAAELNAMRERWLHPPEWMQTRTLEFPGSAAGPWARYIDPATVDAEGVGTVCYPRLEPRDAACAERLGERTLTKLYNERPEWLAHAHATLDAAVAAAYGWPADLSGDEILSRLLALNHRRFAEENAALSAGKPRLSRGKHADEMI